MTIYIFLFVLITIPMLFLVCVVGGGMLGSYLGQRIGNMRAYASNYPIAATLRHHTEWGNRLGLLFGCFTATLLVLAFNFFGSIH